MTKAQKVNYLYRIGKGESVSLTPEQKRELRKYRVDREGEYSFYLTKKNLGEYITAVDNLGTIQSFRDWCWNTGRADRRFKGSDKKSMKKENGRFAIGWAFAGALFWAMFMTTIGAKSSLGVMLIGAVISGVLSVYNRKYVLFVSTLLPILLIALVGMIRNA